MSSIITAPMDDTTIVNKTSTLLQPFRCIGKVSSSIPFSINNLGDACFIAVPIGKSFNIYNCDKLRLILSSKIHNKKINAIETYEKLTFVSIENKIYVYNRYDLISIWIAETDEIISHLYRFGTHLLSISGNVLYIWEIETGLYNKLELSKNYGNITFILHPNTYLNKILIGYSRGFLELYNIRSLKFIYKYKLPEPLNNFKEYSLTSACVSPILDIIALGSSDGRIWFLNLKKDEIILEFNHNTNNLSNTYSAVTALCFRQSGSTGTDSECDELISGSANGSLAIWDWHEAKLMQIIPDAHKSIVCMKNAGNSIITNGDDNSIKMWMFERETGLRMLRYREGPSEPPVKVQYMEDGLRLLVASLDQTVRVLAIRRDEQAITLSQKGAKGKHFGKVDNKWNSVGYGSNATDIYKKQMLPIVNSISTSSRKEKDWANVLTVHQNSSEARAWRSKTGAIDTRIFENASGKALVSCCISGCGNFGLVGSVDGALLRFNLQSFEARGTYVDKSLSKLAHKSAIVALACDELNRYIVSAGQEGLVKLWDFNDMELIQTIRIENSQNQLVSIQSMIYHSNNELVAVACDDLSIRVVDCETKRIVRIFNGYSHRVSDMTFSNDGRWLIASSLDCCMYIWDLASGLLIDWLKFESAVTSVSMSPTGDFIATTHINQLGVFLWANLAHFANVYYSVPKTPVEMYLPRENTEDTENEVIDSSTVLTGIKHRISEVGDVDDEEEGEESDVAPEDNEGAFLEDSNIKAVNTSIDVKPFEHSSDLITLSSLPKAKWVNLTQLDTIKARNKPKVQVKTSEAAPFFLPTLANATDIQFVIPNAENNTKVLHTKGDAFESAYTPSKLVQMLEDCEKSSSVLVILGYLSEMSISAADACIRQIGVDLQHEEEEINLFLDFLIKGLSSNVLTQVDLIEAYMQLFLKIHGAVISSYPSLNSKLQKLKNLQTITWRRLEESFQANLSLVQYLSNTQI